MIFFSFVSYDMFNNLIRTLMLKQMHPIITNTIPSLGCLWLEMMDPGLIHDNKLTEITLGTCCAKSVSDQPQGSSGPNEPTP